MSGDRVIRALQHVGYSVPLHDTLKAGTLHGILAEVAQMRSIATESLMQLLGSRIADSSDQCRGRQPITAAHLTAHAEYARADRDAEGIRKRLTNGW